MAQSSGIDTSWLIMVAIVRRMLLLDTFSIASIRVSVRLLARSSCRRSRLETLSAVAHGFTAQPVPGTSNQTPLIGG